MKLPSCRDVSVLYSRGELDRCSWIQRLLLRGHLVFCKLCRRYIRQLKVVDQSARLRWGKPADETKAKALAKRIQEKLNP